MGHRYFFSCGLMLLPAMAWNAVLAGHLPPAFQPAEFDRALPPELVLTENVLRVFALGLPFFMPLGASTKVQRLGLGLFVVGTLVYFASWLPLVLAPESAWSTSALGFLAPAYTPALWLAGLGLTGRELFIGKAYRPWMYFALSAAFVAAHVTHAAIIYARNH